MAALFAAICDQSLCPVNIITEGDAANVLLLLEILTTLVQL